MPGITAKRLEAVQKTLEAVFADDPDQIEAVTKGLDGLRAAIAKGETVTADDLSDILGEVVVEKAVSTPAPAIDPGDIEDPVAPIFVGLYKQLYGEDGKIQKSAVDAQTLFQKAYEQALSELDGAIEGAVEATAVKLRKDALRKDAQDGDPEYPKRRRRNGSDAPDPANEDDEDCDDMQKLLKAAGVSPALVAKITKMQSTIDELTTASSLEKFTKQAKEIGEGADFGKTLMAMHEADPKVAEEVVKRLKAKNALLAKSDTWSREIGGGAGRSEGSSALEQLNGHAHEMVQKGEADAGGKKMTFAKAFRTACDRFPELYTEYQRDREARRA